MGYSKSHQYLYKLVDYRKWRYTDAKCPTAVRSEMIISRCELAYELIVDGFYS